MDKTWDKLAWQGYAVMMVVGLCVLLLVGIGVALLLVGSPLFLLWCCGPLALYIGCRRLIFAVEQHRFTDEDDLRANAWAFRQGVSLLSFGVLAMLLAGTLRWLT